MQSAARKLDQHSYWDAPVSNDNHVPAPDRIHAHPSLALGAARTGADAWTVLRAEFSNVHRYRSHGRIEAEVLVTFRFHPALPSRTERILTSIPLRKAEPIEGIRDRLIKSAVQLAILMRRADRGHHLKAI